MEQVLDAASGAPIADVSVKVGALTTTTASDGTFRLDGVPVGPFVVTNFSKSGYVDQTKPAETLTVAGTSASLVVPMLPVAHTETFDPAQAAAVIVAGSTASVQLPAGALVRGDGSAPAGSVTAQVTPISPATAVDAMPGNYTAVAGGTIGQMESFGAVDYTFRDAQGNPLNMRAGQTATIRIPVSSRAAAAPPTLPLFHFDPSSGRWVQEGSASLQGTPPNQFYEGSVTHFTAWNADVLYQSVGVTGCVVDASGARLANVRVRTEGVDYSGTASAVTDAQGNFRVPMKSAARAVVQAFDGGRVSNAVPVDSAGADVSLLPQCLRVVQAAASIRLTWGENPNDLDSHLKGPSRLDHVFFESQGNLGAAPHVNLDVDDVDSFGPEVVTIARLARNRTYRYFVHLFGGSGSITQSPARVELTMGGTTRAFTPSAGEGTNPFWHVFDLTVDSTCGVAVNPVQAWVPAEPAAPDGDAPVEYCD